MSERKLDLSEWSPYGDPCPCCGGDSESEESMDGLQAWWHNPTRDDCEWSIHDWEEPCPNWPHSDSAPSDAPDDEQNVPLGPAE